MAGKLYYGDNYDVLRQRSIADASVDLIYLDPPFNSNANYNLLFKSPDGQRSHAQIEAFGDTWHWTDDAELAFDAVLKSTYSEAAIVLRAIRSALGENDLMAYLAMMAVRLVELHRVLKPTGNLFLHCDSTASHYLKLMLDGIFGHKNYRNEIIWQRSNAHNTAKQFGRVHDTILFYSMSDKYTWNTQYQPYSEAQLKRYKKDASGRLYTCQDLTASRPNSDSGKFEWRGTFPGSGRGWGYTREQLEEWWNEGRIACKRDGTPRLDGLISYLDDMKGKPVQDVWTDIERISNTSKERLGYPTQKPLALLERIILAASNEGDTVLDPFCGCGTATHAAHKLNRNWIGIDITSLAINVIRKRLHEAFPGIQFEVFGVPKDAEGAAALAEEDKYEFQKWIVPLIGGQLYQGGKKGMDRGVDGYLHFRDADMKPQMAVISVKGGKNVSAPMIRDLKATVEREQAKFGVFLTLAPPSREMSREAAAAGIYETGGQRIPKLQILTVAEILDGKRPQTPFGYTEGLPTAVREKTSSQASFDWQEEGNGSKRKTRQASKANGQTNPAGEVHSDGQGAGMPRRGRHLQRRAEGSGKTATQP